MRAQLRQFPSQSRQHARPRHAQQPLVEAPHAQNEQFILLGLLTNFGQQHGRGIQYTQTLMLGLTITPGVDTVNTVRML